MGESSQGSDGRDKRFMKIIACVRTFNEELNIRRFMESYVWADKVIVADSGSQDDTVSIAESYDNARVFRFGEKVKGNGFERPPHGRHINELIMAALQLNADWIIFDDCDCVPSYLLRLHARDLLENTDKDVVFAYRMYMYGDDEWFPGMSVPGQSLWAWRYTVNIWASEKNPLRHEMLNITKEGEMINFPRTLLHYFAPDEETIQRKMAFYDKYKPTKSTHPLEFCGKLEKIPEWART